jgi:hypothetical protein
MFRIVAFSAMWRLSVQMESNSGSDCTGKPIAPFSCRNEEDK